VRSCSNAIYVRTGRPRRMSDITMTGPARLFRSFVVVCRRSFVCSFVCSSSFVVVVCSSSFVDRSIVRSFNHSIVRSFDRLFMSSSSLSSSFDRLFLSSSSSFVRSLCRRLSSSSLSLFAAVVVRRRRCSPPSLFAVAVVVVADSVSRHEANNRDGAD